ncbi:VOC family protein [Virgisporangium ochraceum]
MLDHSAVEANIPAADLDRAREYYSDKLGLTPVSGHEGQALRYRTASGTFFNVYLTRYAGQAGHTLEARGVVFEVYPDMPGVEWTGSVATIPGMGKAAWFKDSEGNIMCVDDGAPAN